jgi:ADP-ribosylation factor 1/2
MSTQSNLTLQSLLSGPASKPTWLTTLTTLPKPLRDILRPLGLYSSRTRESRLFDSQHGTILILGLDCAGKTSFLHHYLSQSGHWATTDILTSIPTIGFVLESVQYAEMRFVSYDSGCCGCRSNYMKRFTDVVACEADAVVWVVDANDRERLVEAREELSGALKLKDGVVLRRLPVLVLANKMDLPDAMGVEEIGKGLGLEELENEWVS